jgi:hypothetical protein
MEGPAGGQKEGSGGERGLESGGEGDVIKEAAAAGAEAAIEEVAAVLGLGRRATASPCASGRASGCGFETTPYSCLHAFRAEMISVKF